MRNKHTITLACILTIILISLFAGLQGSSANAMPDTSQTLPSQTTAGSITFNVNAAGTAINPYVLGTNLPAWLGTSRTENGTFINRTQATQTTMLRLPGGSWSNGYNWYGCEMNDSGNCWSAPWGLNPSSMIDFLQATGASGMYTINQNGTAKEAAALVAFFNGSVGDNRVIGVDVRGTNWGTVGQWAQLRSDHGNPNPINLKYYEIGNEIYGGKPGMGTDCASWGWEDVWTCDGREYVNGIGSGANRKEGFIEFRNEMRMVDATILVGAVGVTPQNGWTNWGNEVIEEAGDQMDFYVIHQYAYFTPPAGYQDVLAQPQQGDWTWAEIMADYENALDQFANGRSIPVAITEHNLFSVQDQDNGQWMTQAVNMLFMGDTIGQMLTHGVDIANQWDLANGQAGNGTDYGLLNADSYARSPQYYVYPLWSRFGTEMLPLTSSYNAATQLSVYASRIDASTVSVLAINKTGSALPTTIQIDGTSQISSGLADVVKAASLSSQSVTFNNVSNPNDSLSNAPSAPLSNLNNPLSYTFEPYSITLLRLSVDETPPQLSVANTTVSEGNSSTTNTSFTVSLSSASSETVTVNYATANDTATVGSDYTAVSGTLTFNPGDTSKTIQVPVIGDVIDEGSSERFRLNLSNASVNVTASQADGIIQDDDTAQLAIASGPSVVEGNDGTVPAIFNVSLSTPAAFQVTVAYASNSSIDNGPAAPGADYEPVSGTLSFTPGQTSKTITVMVYGDTKFEGDERYNVVLSSANPVTINVSSSTGRIINDDPASDFVFLPAVLRN